MRRKAFLPWAVFLAVLDLSPPPARADVPAGFRDELVAAIGTPVGLAFTPDGRLLVTTQSGTVRVVRDGQLLPAAALAFSSASGSATYCGGSEKGVLGVAVDPAFPTNHFVYVFRSRPQLVPGTCGQAPYDVSRVSRFVLPDSNVISPTSEVVLLDGIPAINGNHNAGDLKFGRDGLLYVSTGDGGCDYAGGGCAGSNDATRDRHSLVGKILRVNRDGEAPADNPFFAGGVSCRLGNASPGQVCRETFAWGFRNPFRFAVDPNAVATRLFANDVGQGAWEEIDDVAPGADYGWNLREGPCANGSTSNCGTPSAGLTNPLFAWRHGGVSVPGTAITGCNAIAGAAFVPKGAFPAAFEGAFLAADYVCGAIFAVSESGGTWSASAFASNLGGSSAVTLEFGPPHAAAKALYYTTYAGGGQVRRIVPDATPRAVTRTVPVALDVDTGAARFTTELTLTNRSGETVPYTFTYEPSLGTRAGAGSVSAVLAAGAQATFPDILGHLRERGLALPPASQDARQGGVLRVRFDGVTDASLVGALARTTTPTTAPLPAGAAGLAYAGIADAALLRDPAVVTGLRESESQRSNLALVNPGDVAVTLRVTAFAGDGTGRSALVTETTLPPRGFEQIDRVLGGPGYAQGWATVERVSGGADFAAYGVVNDNVTNDGSFLGAEAASEPTVRLVVPALVQTAAFRSELVLANVGDAAVRVRLRYLGFPTELDLAPRSQRVLPDAVAFLLAAATVPVGTPLTGAVFVDAVTGSLANVHASARTSVTIGGGSFGVFTPALRESRLAREEAWVFGLRADATTRSNLALVNGGPDEATLEWTLFDGRAGGAGAARGTETLAASGWRQLDNLLSARGVASGWVRVRRLSGAGPFLTYGVLNDGAAPGERTGDGAYVEMSGAR